MNASHVINANITRMFIPTSARSITGRFQLYNSLILVQEYGVWHKLLFGKRLSIHHRRRLHRPACVQFERSTCGNRPCHRLEYRTKSKH